jgi:glycosyltransferase involved in cell wall biosynthesis
LAFLVGTLGFGGAERQLFYLATAHRELGAAVRVLSFSRGEHWERELVQTGIPVTCVGERAIIPLRLGRIVRELQQHPPDIVQCAHFYTSMYGITAARILRLREVGAIRTDLRREISKPDPLSAKLSLRLLRRIAVASKAAIRQAVAHGVPTNRLYYVPNVVDTDEFRPGGDTSGGVVRLLTIGRLHPDKRHDRLLGIMAAAVKQARHEMALTIVGEGPLRLQLKAEAARLGLLPGMASFHPAVPHVGTLYRDANIFVLASDYEGTPNVILEAMACGLPVVATSAGDVPEIVVDGETGYLSPPDSEDVFVDRLLKLVHDEKLRVTMGDRARGHVETHFARNTLPPQLEEFYRWAQGD